MMNSNKVKKIYMTCMVLVAVMTVASIYVCGSSWLEGLSVGYVRNVAVDAMGLLTGSVLLLGLYAQEKNEKREHAMFRMIVSLMILFSMDAVSSITEGNPDYVSAIIVVNTISFIFEDVLCYTYWTYIREELRLSGKFLSVANKVCRIALGISITFDLLNVKFGFFFSVSNTGEYIDSPFEYVGDTAIFTVFVLAVIAIFFKTESKIREKLVLITFETFPFVAYVIGGLTQEYTWVYPAYLLSILLIYIRIFLERGKKIAEQQVTLTKQSTALMISQIQPHFLYNVLTTISNLCVTDPEEAEETTVLFSQYLRTNLDSLRNQEPVPFSTELGHIRTYVELEKKRFGDILEVEYDINEVNFKVPSLGLQPIVENSIKHGIRGKNALGHVKIGTYKVDEGFKIVIEDDGIGFDMNKPVSEDGRSHVGMTNVKERLKQMCNASMEIESSPGNGCRTQIIIPE